MDNIRNSRGARVLNWWCVFRVEEFRSMLAPLAVLALIRAVFSATSNWIWHNFRAPNRSLYINHLINFGSKIKLSAAAYVRESVLTCVPNILKFIFI